MGLRVLLTALDVPRAEIDREIAEMQFIMYGKASNRSVLGSMNAFAFMLGHYLQSITDPRALADTPMRAMRGVGKFKEFGVPNYVPVELLMGRKSSALGVGIPGDPGC